MTGMDFVPLQVRKNDGEKCYTGRDVPAVCFSKTVPILQNINYITYHSFKDVWDVSYLTKAAGNFYLRKCFFCALLSIHASWKFRLRSRSLLLYFRQRFCSTSIAFCYLFAAVAFEIRSQRTWPVRVIKGYYFLWMEFN